MRRFQLYGICNEIAQHLHRSKFVSGPRGCRGRQESPFGVHRPRVVRGITGQRQRSPPARFQRPVRIWPDESSSKSSTSSPIRLASLPQSRQQHARVAGGSQLAKPRIVVNRVRQFMAGVGDELSVLRTGGVADATARWWPPSFPLKSANESRPTSGSRMPLRRPGDPRADRRGRLLEFCQRRGRCGGRPGSPPPEDEAGAHCLCRPATAPVTARCSDVGQINGDGGQVCIRRAHRDRAP